MLYLNATREQFIEFIEKVEALEAENETLRAKLEEIGLTQAVAASFNLEKDELIQSVMDELGLPNKFYIKQ